MVAEPLIKPSPKTPAQCAPFYHELGQVVTAPGCSKEGTSGGGRVLLDQSRFDPVEPILNIAVKPKIDNEFDALRLLNVHLDRPIELVGQAIACRESLDMDLA